MQVQVLLAMGQDQLSKDKAGEILDQWVHRVTTTQDLWHSTRNLVRVIVNYLGSKGLIRWVTEMWPCHIDKFERQYNKTFAGNHLFGAELAEQIHKRVHVLLHSCNTESLENDKRGALSEFWELQWRFERGECITTTPTWVDIPAAKDN